MNEHEPQLMDRTELQAGLRIILDLLAESRTSYMELCNRVLDRRTKDFLNSLIWERIALETALMTEARRVGHIAADGIEASTDHRPVAWKEVREALSTATGRQVLAACERGEGYLLMRYDEALQRGEPDATTRALLTLQRAKVQGNVNNIRSRTRLEVPAER